MADLDIQESRDEAGSPKVLYLAGFLDSSTSPSLKEKFDDLISRDLRKIVLDMTKIRFMGSAGISVLLEYAAIFQGNSGGLVICCVPEKALKVMGMVGVENILRIFQTQQDALHFYHEEPEIEPAQTLQRSSIGTEENLSAFPFKAKCPQCGKTADIHQPDLFKCMSCEKIFYVTSTADISPLGPDGSDMLQKGSRYYIKIPSNIVYLNSVRAFLTSIMCESGQSEDDTSEIELGLDEAVSNLMEHAYGMDKTKQIEIEFFLTQGFLLIKLKDTGKPFDILAKIKEEEARVGSSNKRGRGCYIIRQVMDKLDYKLIPDICNELVMLRYFKKSAKK